MSQTIKLKRSAIAGKVPTTSSLDLGEVAINTNDGKVFFKKDDGTESIQTFVTTDSLTTGSINLTGAVSASFFTGSFSGDGANLDNIRLFISGVDLDDNNVGSTFSKLQFDSGTGLYVSASDADTAFVFLGSHFRDIFVDGSATLVATGSDQLDIIAGNGLDISTSLTDTNSNSVSKELIFAVDNTIATTGSNSFVGNQDITGSADITGSLSLNGYSFPEVDGTDGQTIITDGSGVLTFDDIKVYATVKNISGVTLAKGTPVHATASISPPAGQVVEVIAASASIASTMPATFILDEALANDAEGRAISSGYIKGVDTSTFTVGDVVYVGESGGYTNVKPTGDSNLIQNLGVVTRVDASNGAGFIYGSGRSNDIPNLPEGKIWVGSTNYSVTSSVVHLDESNGRLGIGTTSPDHKLHVAAGSSAIALNEYNNGAIIWLDGSNGDFTGGDYFNLYAPNETRVSLGYTGGEALTVTSGSNVGIGTTSPGTKLEVNGTATVTSLVETSTRKLKENIETLEDQSSIVDSLTPVSYTWKESKEEDFGLIAEDAAEIAPHLVSRDEDGNPSGIKYSKLSVLLLDVVQRQSTIIENLNERITKLENERG